MCILLRKFKKMVSYNHVLVNALWFMYHIKLVTSNIYLEYFK